MRHKKFTFKIGKSPAHRKALIANMLTSLFKHGQVKTTVTKAKEVRRWADKMITCGKAGDLHNRRKAIATIRDIDAVRIVFDDLAPKYKARSGGYTRVIRFGTRKGDGAELCVLQLVEEEFTAKTKAVKAEEAEAPTEAVVEEAEVVAEETEAAAESDASAEDKSAEA